MDLNYYAVTLSIWFRETAEDVNGQCKYFSCTVETPLEGDEAMYALRNDPNIIKQHLPKKIQEYLDDPSKVPFKGSDTDVPVFVDVAVESFNALPNMPPRVFIEPEDDEELSDLGPIH